VCVHLERMYVFNLFYCMFVREDRLDISATKSTKSMFPPYMYTYIYIYIRIHTYVPIYLIWCCFKDTHIQIDMHVYTYVYVNTYMYTYMYMYLHTYMYIYIHVYIYTCI